MIEEILNGIYKIPVFLPGSPLKVLNSYFLKGDESDYLIDTGFNIPDCYEALSSGLKHIGADKSRINVLNTHMHADHTGQNHVFAGKGKHIYMSEADISWQTMWYRGIRNKRYERDKLEGATEEFFREVDKHSPSVKYLSEDVSDRMIPIYDKQIIEIGDYKLQVLIMPGHSVGNCMFWLDNEKIMFTGDHVLFDITPNITAWPVLDDTLGCYLDSLERSKTYPVELALPGHRGSGDYYKRIEELQKHHELRLNEITDIIGNSEERLNAYQITALMKWRIRRDPDGNLPITQRWFATGECLAHLDRLLAIGKIERIEPYGSTPYRTYRLK